MADGKTILVGKSEAGEQVLTLALANRHGLVTGATGTGKTVTLQVIAEGLSKAGVPVFTADIKGDLSGISVRGQGQEPLVKRAKDIGIPYAADQFPAVFWDVFGDEGHPIRATVMEMGPLLLSRLLDLNDTQEGVLNIVFRIADDNHWPLIDMKDLRAVLVYVAEQSAQIKMQYGNVTNESVGAIQRQLLILENQGAAKFFGEPALDIHDFIRRDANQRGFINILAADKLMQKPRLYATFLLWMLSELFEQLPEIGDPTSPSSSSSSTRRICSSPMLRTRCSPPSSRWCVSSARRASASISSRRTRSTCRTACWASSATAFSMRCAPSRRATRRR